MAETPQTSQPVLLLPFRLETRFRDNKLLVRIFPDDVFIETHEPDLTEAEYKAAKQYLSDLAEDKRAAWRTISLRFGSTRAAWIARWVREWTAGHDIESPPPLKPAAWTRAPTFRCMPDYLTVFAYRDDGTFLSKSGEPLQADLTLLASPENWSAEGLLDERSEWIRDFETAKTVGLAIEIGLNSTDQLQGFSRLCVVGIRSGTRCPGAAGARGAPPFAPLYGGPWFCSPGKSHQQHRQRQVPLHRT
jgi:hypothetical protein